MLKAQHLLGVTPISFVEVHLGQVALYCRVSTDDQSCARQEHDLRAFAKRAGHKIVGVFKETASGAKIDRAERAKVMKLAQSHEIDAVLVTELSRWGRSTQDLVQTLDDLHHRGGVTALAAPCARQPRARSQGHARRGAIATGSRLHYGGRAAW